MTSTPITTADIAKGKIDDALSVREKIGYGLGRCEQVPDMRSSYSSGAHPRGTS